MIRVEQLCFEYPGTRALQDVSFDIAGGTITALVGPNGAGKTTLLRCIAALDTPFAGSIRVDGIDVVDEPRACHRRIGYLSDFFGLYTRLSVRQGLGYVAAAQGMADTAIPSAIEQAVAAVGIADKLDLAAGTLSRGQRQRVAIAQAIVHSPPVLLLDEPASGLDPEARADLASLFTRLGESGMTLLVSSHILAELSTYCTDMLILREGRVVEHRPLAEDGTSTETLRVRLTEAPEDWPAPLAAEDGVLLASHDALGAEFEFSGDIDARAALLARLVQRGLGVAEFGPAVANLQDRYLRSLRAQGETPP